MPVLEHFYLIKYSILEIKAWKYNIILFTLLTVIKKSQKLFIKIFFTNVNFSFRQDTLFYVHIKFLFQTYIKNIYRYNHTETWDLDSKVSL